MAELKELEELEQIEQLQEKKISLETLNFIQGDKFDLENDKYYVLEFWATWCPPCVRSIPHLNDLYIKYSKYVNFVSITSDPSEKIIKMINNKKEIMTYPVAEDVDNILHEELNISGIPIMFILNGNSKIIWSGHPGDDMVITELEKIKQLNS